MAQLDDKTLQNLNKRLEDMDRLLATDYQKAMDLGKAFTQGFTTEQIDAFLKKLNTISRKDAAKLNVALNLVDVNGRPLTLSEVKRRISQIENAINRGQTSTSIRGTRIVGTTAMTNELQRYKDALSILGMSTSQQFDLIRNGVRGVNNETKGVKSNLENLLPTLRRLASAFGLYQIRNFISGMVKIRGEFEMAEVALKNIIGNSEKAQTIWKKTMNLAVNSPLTAQQLTGYTKQLAAFRIETNKLYDTTKMLADVSVGLGVDMQRLILAYGHTKSSGFLRGMYARQFATAGVNIYGELADYYTKIEGKLVTFKDVYERISKKMVSFADVEKVFEKITSKGGQFYNMQEVLSNTVQGQINKIKDSWQQAMNDIGKSQTGMIRGITNAVLQIVKNWRTWLSVIEGTTVAVIAFKATNIVRALVGTSYAANAASKSTLRLANSFKALGASFKANLPALAVSTVIAAGVAVATAVKHMKDFNKELDNQNTTLYDARQKLLEYQKRVEENNKVIREYKEGNDKSEEALKRVNKAQKDNQNVVSALRKEYPELEAGTKTLIDGEVQLTAKLEAHNQSLRDQISLNDQIKQQGITDDPFSKDAQQFNDELQKNIKDIQKYQSRAKVLLAKGGVDAVQESLLNQLIGIDLKNPERGIREYNNIVKSIVAGATQAYDEAWEQINRDNTRQKDPYAYRDYKQQLTPSFYQKQIYGSLLGVLSPIDEVSHAKEEFDRELNEIREDGMSLLEQLRIMFLDAVGGVPEYKDEINKKYSEALTEYKKQLKAGQTITDEAAAEIKRGVIAEYVIANTEKIVKDVQEGSNDVNETIRTFMVTQGYALNSEMENVLNDRLSKYILYHEKQAQLQALEAQLAAERHKKEKNRVQSDIDAINAEIADLEKQMPAIHDFFAEIIQKTLGGEDGDNSEKNYKDFNALLDIIKKMNGEYEKLSKSAYGYAKSAEMVKNSYREAFDSILGKGASDLVNWDTLDFTSKQGVRNALQELYDNLSSKKLWGKYGKKVKDLQDKLKREIANFDVEIGIDAQVRIREDFGRQMEEAFGNYELTLEIDKMNLSKGLGEEMFGIEAMDISQMRNILETWKEERLASEKGFEEDARKLYQQWLKKLDDEELKHQKERIKNYSKYLEYQLSERAKLEMEYVKKLAEVRSEPALASQLSEIEKGIVKEFNESMAKQDWEDFKGSEFYVEMMEDLEKQGSASLGLMRQRLLEVRDNAKNLSPRALKEVIKALEKIEEIESNRKPPLQSLRENAEKLKGIDMKGILSDIADSQERLANQENTMRAYDQMIALEEARERLGEAWSDEAIAMEEVRRYTSDIERLEKKIKEYKVTNDKAADAERIDNLQSELNVTKEQLEIWESLLKTLKSLGVINLRETENPLRGLTLGELKEQKRLLEEEIKGTNENISNYQQYVLVYNALKKAQRALLDQIKGYFSEIQTLFGNTMTMLNNFGAGTDEVTGQWTQFVNAVLSSSSAVLDAIKQFNEAQEEALKLGEDIATGNYITLALRLASILVQISAELGLFRGARIDKEIREAGERIDNLTLAYNRLESAIEKAYKTTSYLSVYNQRIENINEQIKETEAQLAAAQHRKKVDQSEVNGYLSSLDDLYDKLEDVKSQMQETFGGIGGESNYRSWAEGFADVWKSAFLETGDGLDALQDHFDEFLQEWFVKQATMRIAGNMLQPLMKQIDAATNDGRVSANELAQIQELARVLLPEVNERMREFAGMWDLDSTGSLSGLAAGIQGMTEEQANILESYWNSVRMYTASIDSNVARIADLLGTSATVQGANPMLQQLTAMAQRTNDIYVMLNGLTGTTPSARGLRVIVNNLNQ